MIKEEEVEEYYKENYQNQKEGTGLSINKQLWIDYQRFCLDLSRKTMKKITASARIRLLMVRDMLENKKSDRDR